MICSVSIILLAADADLTHGQMDGFLITSKDLTAPSLMLWFPCPARRPGLQPLATWHDECSPPVFMHVCIKKCLCSRWPDGWAGIFSGRSLCWVSLYFGLACTSAVRLWDAIFVTFKRENPQKKHLLWPCISGQIRSDAPSLLIDYSLTSA